MTRPRQKNWRALEVGDRVSIIRTRHGWWDGRLEGEVVRVSPLRVRDEEGYYCEIEHRRDVRYLGPKRS